MAADYDEQILRDSLQEWWGYDHFRNGQLDVIAQVMQGRDTLALMPTGAGKSLCYQLPAMLLPGLTLVISPLIALMKDQYDNLPPQIYERATFINSSLEPQELEQRLAALLAGKYKLIYAAPERLRQRPFLEALRRAGVRLVVVDEAHCVSLWGHDFRPDYLFLSKALPLLGEPQLLALTATATPAMQGEIGTQLGRNLTIVRLSSYRRNLRYEVRQAANAEAKLRLAVAVCKQERGAGIVYATSRANCEQVAATLRREGVSAEFYHAGLDSAERSAVQERFMLDRTRVIVATVAFGMGVDKANVRFIVHYNLPKSLEGYAQESGRAGRDGKPARCVLLYTSGDKGNLTSWAHREQLHLPFLREVYRAVRTNLKQGITKADGTTSGLVYSNELLREVNAAQVGEADDTKMKVAISLMERAGLLARHLDAPRTASVLLNDVDPARLQADRASFARFCDEQRLYPGYSASFDLPAAGRPLALAPDELEAHLLAWEAVGLLQYRPTGREMVLAIKHQPGDASAAINRLLEQQEQAADERLTQMAAYAEGNRCRHQVIAAHLGEQLPPCGEECDVCNPPEGGYQSEEGLVVPAVANVAAAIMACVRSLPFEPTRSGLARVLLGSLSAPVREDRAVNFGVLGYASQKAVVQAVDELIAAGYLRVLHKDGLDFPLVGLGPQAGDKPAADLVRLKAKLVVRKERRGERGWGGQSGQAYSTAPRPAYQSRPSESEPSEMDEEAIDLFERLRAWRTSTARSEKLPPYIILHDKALRDIAQRKPHNVAALAQCQSIGGAKLEKYGVDILRVMWGEGYLVGEEQSAASPRQLVAQQSQNAAQAIIECVDSLPVDLSLNKLSYVLIGSVAAIVKPARCQHHGIFAHALTSEVRLVIHKLATAGYLALGEQQDPLVGLGSLALAGAIPPANLIIVPASPAAGQNREVAQAGRELVPDPDELDAAQAHRYQLLLDWRQAVSVRDGVQLTNLFYSSSLRSVAALAPQTLHELSRAYGVSSEAIMRYGAEVLRVIWGADYVVA